MDLAMLNERIITLHMLLDDAQIERDEWKARAEAAEAKLADLRNQLGDGFWIQVPGWEYDWGPEEDREDDE